MFQDKYIFAQLTVFLDRNHFNCLVRKYGGDEYVKYFTCWNQLLALMSGQLSNRESLRNLIVALETHQGKTCHLGPGKHITRSNLANANPNRDYHIFEAYANKHVASRKLIYSSSAEMFMPLTLQQSAFA